MIKYNDHETRELRARIVYKDDLPSNDRSGSKSRLRIQPPSRLLKIADRSDRQKNNQRLNEGGFNSRSSSSQHLMPLRLGAHTECQGEKEREDHDEANL